MGTLKRVSGSTLVEALVASTILLLMLALFSLVFLQLYQAGGTSQVRVQAIQAVDLYAYETEVTQQFEDAERVEEDLVLKRLFIGALGAGGVKVEFVALDKGGRVLTRQQKIIPLH